MRRWRPTRVHELEETRLPPRRHRAAPREQQRFVRFAGRPGDTTAVRRSRLEEHQRSESVVLHAQVADFERCDHRSERRTERHRAREGTPRKCRSDGHRASANGTLGERCSAPAGGPVYRAARGRGRSQPAPTTTPSNRSRHRVPCRGPAPALWCSAPPFRPAACARDRARESRSIATGAPRRRTAGTSDLGITPRQAMPNPSRANAATISGGMGSGRLLVQSHAASTSRTIRARCDGAAARSPSQRSSASRNSCHIRAARSSLDGG